jgi:hypothetical protein
MIRWIAIALVGLLVFGTLAFAANTKPLARIMSYSGEVRVKQISKKKNAVVKIKKANFPLLSGDVVWTRRDASATILFDGGGIVKMAPNGELIIKKNDSTAKNSGAASRLMSGMKSLFSTKKEVEVAGISPLTRDQQKRFMGSPNNCFMADFSPVIRWHSVKEATGYRLRILTTREVVYEMELSGTELDLGKCEVELRYGEMYSLHLEALSYEGVIASDKGWLIMAEEKTLKELREMKKEATQLAKELGPDDSTPDLLLARYLEEKGFWYDAAAIYRNMLKKKPNSLDALAGLRTACHEMADYAEVKKLNTRIADILR